MSNMRLAVSQTEQSPDFRATRLTSERVSYFKYRIKKTYLEINIFNYSKNIIRVFSYFKKNPEEFSVNIKAEMLKQPVL